MRIKIERDLFDIADRLREINPDYGVVFDTETQKFAVTMKGRTVLSVPFENLDERTVRRVVYTRAENIDEVIKDIGENNERVRRESNKSAADKFENEFSRLSRLGRI